MDGSRKATTPSEVSIKKATNGGYIVRHSFDNSFSGPSYTPPQEHAFSDHKSMMRHVQKAVKGGAKAVGRKGGGQKVAPSHRAGIAAAKTRGHGVD